MAPTPKARWYIDTYLEQWDSPSAVDWMRNVPHRLNFLNTWSPVDGAVWGGYRTLRMGSLAGGSMPLAVGVYSLTSFPAVLLTVWDWGVISQLPVPDTMASSPWINLAFWNHKPKETFFFKCLLIMVIYYSKTKVTNIASYKSRL